MSVRVFVSDENVTAYLAGELDHHAAKGIREEIDDAVLRSRPTNLILDFRDVTFMDSSGIGLVMGQYSLMQGMDGEVVIENMSGYIGKVMRLAGLDKLARMGKGAGRQ